MLKLIFFLYDFFLGPLLPLAAHVIVTLKSKVTNTYTRDLHTLLSLAR